MIRQAQKSAAVFTVKMYDQGDREMTLSKKTRLGTVTVNNNVIAKVILRAAEKTEGKLFLSSERGRRLGVASRIGVGDISGNFEIEEKEGAYYLSFSGIVQFGSSIKSVTDTVLDHIQEEMQQLFPCHRGVITLHIVGVKSKQIAERDIEVKREYEAAR